MYIIIINCETKFIFSVNLFVITHVSLLYLLHFTSKTIFLKQKAWTSLVVQWLGIHLLMWPARVRSLIWADPTWCTAIKHMCPDC